MSGVRNNRRRLSETMRFKRGKRFQLASLGLLAASLLIAIVSLGSWLLAQRFESVQWRVQAPQPLKARIEAHLQQLQPQGLWDARPQAVRRYLQRQVLDIDRIEVSRTLPNSLQVLATVRLPIALWESPEGVLKLVDTQGRPFRPLERGEQVDLPLLRLDADHLQAAVNLLKGMRNDHSPWLSALSEVFADIDGWRLNLSAGQQWLIPFGKESLQYVRNITGLLQQSRWNAGIWRIDARQSARWFIRPSAFQGVT